MRVGFLHISDIHNSENVEQPLKQEQLIRVFNAIPIPDFLIVICSGDLAYSGKAEEYGSIDQFFEKLINDLRDTVCSNVYFFIVPGNHDLDLDKRSFTNEEIIDIRKKGKPEVVDNAFVKEMEALNSFFEYSRTAGCFCDHNDCDKKILDLDSFQIQVNLLNTAPFSISDSKGIQYLPDSANYVFKRDEDANMSILIMHHGPSWFDWESQRNLRGILSDVDFVFQGHDHISDTLGVKTADFDLLVSKGGEFSGRYTHETTFSLYVFDTADNVAKKNLYKWDANGGVFVNTPVADTRIELKTSRLLPCQSYQDELLSDHENLSNKVLDYFVFPILTQKEAATVGEQKAPFSENALWETIFEKDWVNIVGKENGGKTTLLKYLYSKSVNEGLLPIFIESGDLRPRQLSTVVEDSFREQYGAEPADFERFCQAEKSRKIAFVDDFDLINSDQQRSGLLNRLLQEVGSVVVSCKDTLDIGVVNSVQKELSKANGVEDVRIEDFYKSKRRELIKQVCHVCKISSDEDMDALVLAVDQLVQKKHSLFSLSPETIIQYVKFFLAKTPEERKGEQVFNVIFETNIKNSIIACSSKERDVQYYLILLEELAYYLHSNKKEYLSCEEISDIVDAYNKRVKLEVDQKKFISTICEAKIVKEYRYENKFGFANRNYLAYFIACKISKLMEDKGLKTEEVNYLIDNICFGINDTILMFITYLRKNTNFALSLCELVNKELDSTEELNFDGSNISFFGTAHIGAVKLPKKHEKEKFIQTQDIVEEAKQKHEEEELQYQSIYDYDEGDIEKFHYKTERIVKYIELIAKSLISHYGDMDVEQKQRIVDCLYSAPSKVLLSIMQPLDDKYQVIIDELFDFVNSVDLDESQKITREKIERTFVDVAQSICLGFYDRIAILASNQDTLPMLQEYDLITMNHRTINLMFHENGNSTDSFVDLAVRMFGPEKNARMKIIIQLIARKHILTHDSIHYDQRARIASKIFPGTDKIKLLLMTGKNDIEL